MLALVGFIEGYDLVMTGSLVVLAKGPLHLTGTDIRILVSFPTFMLCLGGFFFSAISDHLSRKIIVLIGVFLTTFLTLLIPLVQNAEQLIILRLLTGLGAGGVVSAAFPIAAELMPAQHRRTYSAVYEMALAASFTVVPFIGGLLAGNANAFRFLALPGGLAVTVVPVIVYFVLPESPRWYLRKGQVQAAVDIVNQIIRRAGNRVSPLTVRELGNATPTGREKLPPYWALFARGQLRWTTVGILAGICAGTAFFLISVLLPKALVDQGFGLSSSLGLTSIVYAASFFGKGFTGFLMEIIGRRWTISLRACRIAAGPSIDAVGAPRGELCRRGNGGGRADPRLYSAVGLYRDASLSVRAVSHRVARSRAYFWRVVRAALRRRRGAVSDGAAHRFTDDLLWHDLRRGRDRRLHPGAVRQGDRWPTRNRDRNRTSRRLAARATKEADGKTVAVLEQEQHVDLAASMRPPRMERCRPSNNNQGRQFRSS